ncbi:RraA family protein [Bosea sp. (in: a-proteobacteria)]|uniref:RraA family protein n=1 Tax=Bosea sp. (in: a-proteobacteria) TaxID=1871050 RepID=UPI00261A95D0|nr:RraA family protein [Bosea sp. (in: a-proteobacteria)]MCO5089823.1 RraA family protein [Bosea sp. (in: a-proteobacteria)]
MQVVDVRRHFERCPDEQLAVLRNASTGFVVDAQGRRGSLAHKIKPVGADSGFVGRALTVRCQPWDNLAVHAALQILRPGDVLTIATGAFEQAAVIGEKIVGMARNQGAVAIVTDGLVRDTAGIARVGIPVFAAGATANSCYKTGPGEIGFPVSLGGVVIEAGDVLVGDRDGVVCVPRRHLDQVCANLAAITAKETAMFDAIASGGPKPEAMASITAELPLRYHD